MKAKLILAAFVAALFVLFALSPRANAAPVQTVSSGGDFVVASVVEVPGTYPPVVYLYGASSRDGLTYGTFGVLTSTNGFATNPTWQDMTGVVGYASMQANVSIVTCPAGKTCGGYKAFYLIDSSPAALYRCTGLATVKDLSGCALWSVAGMTGYASLGIGLDQSGDKLLVGGWKVGDTKSQIYSIDIASSTATKLSACSDPTKHSYPNGSIAGDGVNQYFYLNYDYSDHYRYTWNGSTCSGGRTKIVGVMGWDNAVNDAVNTDDYGAVGQLTGTFYLSRSDGTFMISKKDASCGDSFISLGSSETCDPNNVAHTLNDQDCTTIGMGFTGGTLGCNAGTCGWDTSSCTSPAVCGNNIKEGPENCDGSDFGGATCASIKGVGWTGSLTCTSCTTIGTGSCSPPPPTCGDSTCNGSETCATCPGDCGVCCGNGTIDSGEDCDGSTLGGATCNSVLGSGYTGTLSCKVDCTFNSSACIPPETCGNGMLDTGEQCDGSNLGSKTCTSEMGAGWSGTLSCNSCMVVTSACSFDWGVKNLSGSCSKGGSGVDQLINFTGGNCSGEYWPIGAVTGTQIKWLASAGKTLAVVVVPTGGTTNVATPQGVSHEEVVDNGNKYQANAGGVGLGVEGTTYSAVEQLYPIIAFGCTEGSIRLSFNSEPIGAIDIDGTPGKVPAGYGVEVNVLTGEVTKAPFKLDGSGGSGSAGGTGGTAGDSGTGGEINTGGTAGDSGTASASGGGDGGGCSCATVGSGGNSALLFYMLMVAFVATRRRNKS